ncbi:phosphatase PAP2 family protein [Fervidobacterium thailandense]|uniref:Phosphatidic acid phosphatase type 2/haloperoxidase domain-containing protein n=1 Tax=Fervidobacterium thailandense TaxID=1008305 RepID=A0A1E3G3N4_9BACT|nr:phosphatase PAP2 family protein [Fervidobacterium thailandense]ODN30298.1 hypothetical protein A4H02_06335 [Fervidobacterium thailandense]
MRKYFLLPILVLVLIFSFAFDITTPNSQQDQMPKISNNTTSLFHSSNATDYLPFLAPLLVIPLDETVRLYVPKLKFLESLDHLEFEHFFILAASTSLFISYYDVSVARAIAQSFIATSTVTALLKFIIGRARPYVNIGALTFNPFSFSKSFQSFPSGHASLSWTIFTPIAQNFGAQWYFVPVILSTQRLWSDEHWLSDVIFGSVLGWWIANRIQSEK